MKLKIGESNRWLLLVNLICSRAADTFENPIVSESYIPDKIGDIKITSVKRGRTFEDVYDGEVTTVVEGSALVALNCYEHFRLIMSTDGNALLVHYNPIPPMLGRDATEVILNKALLDIEGI